MPGRQILNIIIRRFQLSLFLNAVSMSPIVGARFTGCGPIVFYAFLRATLAAWPKAAPFDPQILLAERCHDTGPAGFQFHFDDLIGFRANDRSAAAVAAIAAKNRWRDDEIEAENDNASDE